MVCVMTEPSIDKLTLNRLNKYTGRTKKNYQTKKGPDKKCSPSIQPTKQMHNSNRKKIENTRNILSFFDSIRVRVRWIKIKLDSKLDHETQFFELFRV